MAVTASAQLPSLLDDDFEVIEENQSSISNSMSPYEMQQSPESVNSPMHLVDQLATANERCASLRQVLAGSNSSLASLIRSLSERQQQLSAGLDDYGKCRQELSKLKIRQEEWQQTAEDYQALKNQYNLLANTKERLESERDELMGKLATGNSESAVGMKSFTDGHECAFEEQLQLALEVERKKWEAANFESKSQLSQRIKQMKDQLKQKDEELVSIRSVDNSTNQQLCYLEQQNQDLRSNAAAMSEKIVELKNEVQAERTRLMEANRRHNVEMEDLRLNSDVQQLQQLRLDLERRQKREDELQQLNRDSDQTVNDILAAVEADKRAMQEEMNQLRLSRGALETSLVERNKMLEDVTVREMRQKEETLQLTEQVQRLRGIHQVEIGQMQDELRATRSANQMKDAQLQALQHQLETQKSSSEQLSRQVQLLEKAGQDSQRTVNEILSNVETEKNNWRNQFLEEHQRFRDYKAAYEAEQSAHARTTAAVQNFQRLSDGLQGTRVALEQQLADSRAKCDETERLADQLRARLHAETARATDLETELNALKAEHTRVRKLYGEMQHRLTELLAQEHNLTTRAKDAEETQQVLRDTVEYYRRDYEQVRQNLDSLQVERDSLHVQLRAVRNAIGETGERSPSL